MFGQDLVESQAKEQEGWGLGETASFYSKHKREGRSSGLWPKNGECSRSAGGWGGGRAVGALVICVCTGCLFTFARGGHRVSKDTLLRLLPSRMGDKGSALNCSVTPSPQHCFQEVQ